ncbi:phage portal protein [Lactobacillus jensenii]|jgi:phage portal protein, SPP1 family|nr:phage portal protein, SPP1 family [Lactobacillus jensenii 269-3]EEQ68821.1 phage portal protein, SPP1 family [Lactobacillus jensenii 1153]EEX27906.1 phage portal protein, SPP1 family [Lactobacillus jensenii SJ-7A-US]KRM51280.1 phage portal protein, SPP1 family [Lactobacillus jensenii DSM 20557]MCZ3726757.1 phage portal protein [Lactobacillus jensenii]DAT13268.1 MAG TPA: PORTAL PROTEIN [Caudoviricetes sp.]
MDYYLGHHPVLEQPAKQTGADNRLVVNLPKYLVDTYNGFFSGIAPKISLDDDKENQKLQDWNNTNSFVDKLNEISKQADIYGKSYAFVYQDEDSQTRVTYCSPSHAFMVYDDTVNREPLAFVRYHYDNSSDATAKGTIYYADASYDFVGPAINPEPTPNLYKLVPAVEFYENEERQGVFDGCITLINELDRALSQKANQVEYFDNAYLYMLGIQLEKDRDTGQPMLDLKNDRFIYAPADTAVNGKIGFVSKPDGDNMQENLINRLTEWIFQTAMIPNMNDQAFSGNSSGVALQYKLLPMKNRASNKERKFVHSLRHLYQIIFSVGTVLPDSSKNKWQDLSFQFTRNMPANIADEVNSAVNASGIVSKETALSLLSFIDDPKSEINRMEKEKDEEMKRVSQLSPAAMDFQKVNSDDEK